MKSNEETMEAQSERLYGETRALLSRQKLLTENLVGKLLEAGEISLHQALSEIRSFEGGAPLRVYRSSTINGDAGP